jgi:hypothetical protein
VEHVLRQGLEVVGSQVKDFQVRDLVEVPQTFRADLVVGKIQAFEVSEILFRQGWNQRDLIVLQIELLNASQVS